ncbi:MAG: hypothetical protein H6577_06535 [Lewinellaceae bacterium]|nr:hypothetical protein [Saprospiraceae bacterium]MCB9337765.1 hypothetical protein [Lewinellaceae bacterium]
MDTKTQLFFLLALLLSIYACECGKGKDIPDVSEISAPVEIKRFERDLFSLDTVNFEQGLQQLETEYPEFSQLYFGQVLGSLDTTIAPEGHVKYVKGFVTHPSLLKLYDTCMVVFPNTDWLARDFGQAFKFFKYYFPDQPLSGRVVTYISEFTVGGFLYGDNSIGVGLDFYLGESYPYQQYNPMNPNFSQYLTRTFNKDHIVSKSMDLLVKDILGNPNGNRLIDHMIYHGKELYLLDKLLPFAPDSVKLEFSQKQVAWCNDNEANIWAYFLSENLIYSTDWNNFRKYVEFSPNSPGMPDGAPGRTANWLGWQIVKAFMKKNPNTSLQDLIHLDNAQLIMDKSRYKPAR